MRLLGKEPWHTARSVSTRLGLAKYTVASILTQGCKSGQFVSVLSRDLVRGKRVKMYALD
jgi:hypothetical protein